MKHRTPHDLVGVAVTNPMIKLHINVEFSTYNELYAMSQRVGRPISVLVRAWIKGKLRELPK